MRRIRGSQPEIEQQAKTHRKVPTEAEANLWQALRGGKLQGLKFRRQHPLGRFILDFCCPEHHLVIEVDGPIHLQQEERDEERSQVLRAHGYQVLRFSNVQVLEHLPEVLEEISKTVLPPSDSETKTD